MFAIIAIQMICLPFSVFHVETIRKSWMIFFFFKFSTQQSLAYFLRPIFNANFPDHTVTIKHLFVGYLEEFISSSISSSYYILFCTFIVLLIQSLFLLSLSLQFQLCCNIPCYDHAFFLTIVLLTTFSEAWHCCSFFCIIKS